MASETEVNVLDNKQVGLCLAKINNQIIKMRLAVKKGKNWTISNLSRKIKRIQEETTRNEERKLIKARKLTRMQEEVEKIKTLDCDMIALYALENCLQEDLEKLMGADPPLDKRAKARVAHTKGVKDIVISFSKQFPEYNRYVLLYAARKEKGVGARKHGKKRKIDVTNENEAGDVKMGKKEVPQNERNSEKETEKESVTVKTNVKETNVKETNVKEANVKETNVKKTEKESMTVKTNVNQNEKLSSGIPSSNQSETDSLKLQTLIASVEKDENEYSSDSDVIEFDRRLSSDEDFSDEDLSDENLENDQAGVKVPETSVKKDALYASEHHVNADTVSKEIHSTRSNSMVVTRLNLEDTEHGDFVTTSDPNKTDILCLEEKSENKTDEKEDDFIADPFFTTSGTVPKKLTHRAGAKRRLAAEEDSNDESDASGEEEGNFSEHTDLASTFVGLSNPGRSMRGVQRGRGGRGRGTDFMINGRRGRGVSKPTRGDFKNQRGDVRIQRGDFKNQRGRGGASNFDKPFNSKSSFGKPEGKAFDDSALHPSWQAKRKQKSIQIDVSSKGKKITFD